MALIEIDERSELPVWVQLRQRIAYLINSGYYKPGDKLPTVRGLAAEISVNYNTVSKAYTSLTADGYLESRNGSGVYVCDFDAEVGEEFAQEVDEVFDEFIQTCSELGLSPDDIKNRLNAKMRQREFARCTETGISGRIISLETAKREKKRSMGSGA